MAILLIMGEWTAPKQYHFSTSEVSMQQRIVFMGTPEFAVPALRVTADRMPTDQVLVVTQPDRVAGRGRRLQAPPVKTEALELGLDVLQVSTMRDPDVRRRLESFSPDLIVVAAFGLILPKWVLRLQGRGCVNLHASKLPRFRGASPIAAAILCGDDHTGVALMQMEAGLDTGAVYAFDQVDIAASDTTETLTERLGEIGASLLDRHLDALLAGELEARPQRGRIVETKKIVKAHGAIDWTAPASRIERHIRAMWPWPRSWTIGAADTRLQVHAADVVRDVPENEPGVVLGHDEGIVVGTGEGALRLTKVQIAGKPAQDASRMSQHPVFEIGARFGPGDGFVPPEPWIVEAGEA